MVIQHNLAAFNATRMAGLTTSNKAKSSEKLSSGYKVNRAADDAAGLSISEKMRRQIRGLTQASHNCKDGISMVQTAEGALDEVHDMLQRANELAVKAANGTLSPTDRSYIDEEYSQLKSQIDQTRESTTFNQIPLFPLNGCDPATAGNVKRATDRTLESSFELHFGADGKVTASNFMISNPAISSGGITTTGDSWDRLARTVANTLIPNAITQILTTFPSLGDAFRSMNAGNSDAVAISLIVHKKDGPSNTLASASLGYSAQVGGGMPSVKTLILSMDIDQEDFDDEYVNAAEDNGVAKLESTIAHELMHTTMQSTMPLAMTGTSYFPTWFKEGTAQLTGGGKATNWNYELYSIIDGLTDQSDTSRDEQVATYLKKYQLEDRPYGHGYLLCAYLGQKVDEKVNGSENVSASTIASGMNTIFSELIGGKDLGTVLKEYGIVKNANTYKSELSALFSSASPSSDLTAFVRKLAIATGNGNGQGSVIGDLGLSDDDIINNATIANPPLEVSDRGGVNVSPGYNATGGTGGSPVPLPSGGGDEPKPDPEPGPSPDDPGGTGGGGTGGTGGGIAADGYAAIRIHAGADSAFTNSIPIKLFNMSSAAIGLADTNMLTEESATACIDSLKSAIQMVSCVRSYMGAIQNRMEHTIRNLDNVVENTTAAESQIRDTDMAKEMIRLSNINILEQAGQSILAQANQSNQGVMSLLQ